MIQGLDMGPEHTLRLVDEPMDSRSSLQFYIGITISTRSEPGCTLGIAAPSKVRSSEPCQGCKVTEPVSSSGARLGMAEVAVAQ